MAVGLKIQSLTEDKMEVDWQEKCPVKIDINKKKTYFLKFISRLAHLI